jgi:endo-1,4-beta-mannosidase
MSGGGSSMNGPFRIGANYWPRAAGPWMWRRFDATAVAAELTQARALGLTLVRAFGFAPDFCPQPGGGVDAEVLGKLRAFFDAAAAASVGVIWSPLVGHMSGENFDLPGRDGRSLWTDPTVLAALERWVEESVAAVAESPALVAVSLSNEITLWAGPVGAADGAAWVERLAGAVRRKAKVPVGSGDGMMAEFPTRAALPHLDYVGPHVYAADLDPLRQAFAVDVALRRAAALGKPFLLEEVGASTAHTGEAEHAAYLRETVLTAFGAGATAAVWWCLSDFALPDERPYVHHAFELGFGLLRADGSEKPAATEARALATLFQDAELAGARPVAPTVALLRPSYLDEDVPFSWQDRQAMAQALLQSFTLASQAGLDPLIIDEDAPLDGYKLILLPSTQKLRAPTWRRIEAAARAGATVYWSYHGGDHLFHRGPWIESSVFSSLTGLVHHLRYGCVDLPPERFIVKGRVPLDAPARVSTFPAPQSFARIPVEPIPQAPVEILGRDESGRPALTVHQLCEGQVIFLHAPFERYLAALPDGSARSGHRLYQALAEEAGLEPQFAAGHPDVQVRVLDGNGARIIVALHRGWTPRVDDVVAIPRDAELVYDSGNPDGGSFGPKGARVYRLR